MIQTIEIMRYHVLPNLREEVLLPQVDYCWMITVGETQVVPVHLHGKGPVCQTKTNLVFEAVTMSFFVAPRNLRKVTV